MRFAGLVLLTLFISEGIAEKDGFYSLSEVVKYNENITKSYKKYVTNSPGEKAIKIFNLQRDEKYTLPPKQILVYGGLYGSLTATAQVMSFAKNYCKYLRKTSKYDSLLESFEIVFLPIANDYAYTRLYNSYPNKEDLIEENYEITKGTISQKYVDDDKNVLIISIQGIGEDIISGRTDSVKLTDEQQYALKRLTGKNKYKPPGSNSESLFNYAFVKNKYILQYEYKTKKSIDPKNLDEEFEKEFIKVFNRLDSALANPSIVFSKAIENREPEEKKPSTITFYLNVTNNYFYDIKAELEFNITVNYQDKARLMEYFRVQASYIKMYDDQKKVSKIGGSIAGANITSSEDDIPLYKVKIENFTFTSLTKYIFEIEFNRTIGGRIKFDTDTKMQGISYYFNPVISSSRGHTVSLKEDSNSQNKAPKQVVVFIMMLVFLLILLVIVCTFLVGNKSKKLLS